MRNMILVGCWVVVALGALAGCNQSGDQTSDEAAQSIASAATAGGAEIAGQAGQAETGGGEVSSTAVVGGNATLPQGWPDSLPQYPESKIVTAFSNTEEGNHAFAVNLSTDDPVEQVMAFYDEQALAAGYNKLSEISGADKSVAHYSSGSWKFTVTCTAAGGHTGVMLALGTASEEEVGSKTAGEGEGGTKTADAYSGALPADFPADVLKPYPGAEIEHASSRGKEHLLTMTTTDARPKVTEFYEAQFNGPGWTLVNSVDADDSSMRNFQHFGDIVVLTAADKDGGTFITITFTQQ
jgi:hypothetical protein